MNGLYSFPLYYRLDKFFDEYLPMLNAPQPASRADQTLSHNMKLLAHHELEGFGGLGEGILKIPSSLCKLNCRT